MPKLHGRSIETILTDKFKINEKNAKKISQVLGKVTFQELLDIYGLVDDKENSN